MTALLVGIRETAVVDGNRVTGKEDPIQPQSTRLLDTEACPCVVFDAVIVVVTKNVSVVVMSTVTVIVSSAISDELGVARGGPATQRVVYLVAVVIRGMV